MPHESPPRRVPASYPKPPSQLLTPEGSSRTPTGTIDKEEARVVVARLRSEAKRSEEAAQPSDPRVEELIATVAKLQASLEGLHAKLDKS